MPIMVSEFATDASGIIKYEKKMKQHLNITNACNGAHFVNVKSLRYAISGMSFEVKKQCYFIVFLTY